MRPFYRAQEMHNSVWASRAQHPSHYAANYTDTKSTTHACQHFEGDKLLDSLNEAMDLAERAKITQKVGDLMFYQFCMIQMFGVFAEFMANPKIVKNYVFPRLIFGYLTHLEYMELQDQ